MKSWFVKLLAVAVVGLPLMMAPIVFAADEAPAAKTEAAAPADKAGEAPKAEKKKAKKKKAKKAKKMENMTGAKK